MIVAMKQKLGAFCGQHPAQIRSIDEAPEKAARRTERRVMDQYGSKTSARLLERFGEPRELSFAKSSGCHERTSRQAGRERNQGHVGSAAYKWKTREPVIAAYKIAPKFFR
jgi:hypothetical protein